MKKKLIASLLAAAIGFTMIGVSSMAKAAEGGKVISNLDDLGSLAQAPTTIIGESDIQYNSIGQDRMNGRTDYPDQIDNSTMEEFPTPIRQGYLGSCVAMSELYFTYSHMVNLENKLNNTGAEKVEFAPNFGYNYTNKGGASGCDYDGLNTFIKYHGATSIKNVLYHGDSFNKADSRPWVRDANIWKDAQKYSIKENKEIHFEVDSNKSKDEQKNYVDSQLKVMKKALTNGYILSFESNYTPETFVAPETLPGTTTPNSHGGEDAWGSVGSISSESHQMTVVGYDDNMWIDLNKNNVVDPGEKGALKIVDSYYSVDQNPTFFHWVAYDSLYPTTQVKDRTDRSGRRQFANYMRYIIPEIGETPKLYAKYTLNTDDREYAKVYLKAKNKATGQEYAFYPYTFNGTYSGGDFSLDGLNKDADGSFAVALDKIVPGVTKDTVQDYDWSIHLKDDFSSSIALKLKGFEIIDEEGQKYYNANVDAENPVVVNDTEKDVNIDFSYNKPLTIIGLRNDNNWKDNLSEANKPVRIHVDEYGGSGMKTYLYYVFDEDKSEYHGHVIPSVSNSSTFTWTPTKPGKYKIRVDVYAGQDGFQTKEMEYTVYDNFKVDFTPQNEVVKTETTKEGRPIYYVPKGKKLDVKITASGGISNPQILRVEAPTVGENVYEFAPSDSMYKVYAKDDTTTIGYNLVNCVVKEFFVKEAE